MKFSKYLMMAGAAAMLTACSSEEPIVGPDQIVDPTEIEGYAYFNLSMPNNGTRAAGDFEFADGDASEYAVENGKILIFGLPETEDVTSVDGRVQAKYITDAEFDVTTFAANSANTQISSSATKVLAKIKKGTFASNLYTHYFGVVILNDGNKNWNPNDGQTFKDWAENQSIAGEPFYEKGGKKYMIMTNAALYDGYTFKYEKKDGTEESVTVNGPVVLTRINRNNIKDTQEELANIDPAATFYVQRIAAKVTLSGNKEFDEVENYPGAKATITGWKMDLTRKTAYPVQNVWGDNVKNYFTSTSKAWFHSGNPARCHWADSKFYTPETDASGNAKSVTVADCKTNYNCIDGTFGDDNPSAAYIRPNTTGILNMTKGQTTRMVIKANFKLNDETPEKTTLIKFKYATTLFTEATLKAKIVEAAEDAKVTGITADKVSVNLDAAGWFTLAKILEDMSLDTAKLDALAEALGISDTSAAEIAVYKNGECYYPVYIKHFAADQKADGIAEPAGLTPSSTYTDDHTGRYGVVRNNWYDLSVTKITGPGLPTVPEPDPTKPVDELEDDGYRHMYVNCNILNWAKRSQNVEL